MYCPSCGSEQIQGLKYCNRCGANLAPADNALPAKLGAMVWAVSIATALVSLGGLVLVFIFGMEFLGRGTTSTASLVFLIFFLLVVLAISALLVRQLSRLLSAYLSPAAKTAQAAQASQAELSEAATAQLTGQKESMPIDAEQTTRRLEPSHREQKQ